MQLRESSSADDLWLNCATTLVDGGHWLLMKNLLNRTISTDDVFVSLALVTTKVFMAVVFAEAFMAVVFEFVLFS